MTPTGDYPDEMLATKYLIDDAAAEALLADRSVPAQLEPLATVVRALRETATRPVAPSAELAARMAAGVFPGPAEEYQSPTHRPQGRGLGAAVRAWTRTGVRVLTAAPRKATRLSLAAKVAAAAVVVAVVGLGGAGFAGVLPEPAQDRFENVVDSVIPYEFNGNGDENSEWGRRVNEDAKDGGVDGPDISEEARRRGEQHRPTAPPGPPEGVGGKPSDKPGPPEGVGGKPSNKPGPPEGVGGKPSDKPGPPANPGTGRRDERRPSPPPGPPEQ